MGRENKIPEQVIYVCTGSSCKKKGGKQIAKNLRRMVKDHGLKNSVEVIKTDCTDRCKVAAVVCLQPRNHWFIEMNEDKAEKLFQKHILHSEKHPENENT